MDMELAEQETELSYPRDLLRRLSGARYSVEVQPLAREVDPELSLGLSLGGCFSVEPREMPLVRSSSTATLSVLSDEPVSSRLLRTCSLPMEADEQNRKRKEMQSLKRLEAKRKRTEKRSSLRPQFSGAGSFDLKEEPPRPVALRRSSSDFDGRALEAAADPLAPRLRSLKSLQEDDEAMNTMIGNLNRPEDIDLGRNMVDEMPCVSAKGDGPNGRRIEGFLYKYKKGEEVRIVCVCHGSFLTPAEFVKHAGGGEVTHPLRHIVVNPSPSVYY